MGLRKLNRPAKDWNSRSQSTNSPRAQNNAKSKLWSSLRILLPFILFLFFIVDIIAYHAQSFIAFEDIHKIEEHFQLQQLHQEQGFSDEHKKHSVRHEPQGVLDLPSFADEAQAAAEKPSSDDHSNTTKKEKHEKSGHKAKDKHSSHHDSHKKSEHKDDHHLKHSDEHEHPSGCRKAPTMNNGDCGALHAVHRPAFGCISKLIRHELKTFSKIFAERSKLKSEYGLSDSDMNDLSYENAFAMWYMLRSIKPKVKTVIEYNTIHGLSTWLIMKALPNIDRIYVVDRAQSAIKVHYKREKVMFLSNNNDEVNFNISTIPWSNLLLHASPAETVVMYNNKRLNQPLHSGSTTSYSAFYQIFSSAIWAGFKKFLILNNDDFQGSPALSFKWVCERHRRKAWRGEVPLSDNKSVKKMAWAKFEKMYQALVKKYVKSYYEFPPVLPSFVSHAQNFDSKYSAPSLLKTLDQLKEHAPDEPLTQFQSYNYPAYVELK